MPESSKPLPSHFGRYRIFSKLASGGMATVYLARTEHTSGFEKLVALKVIHEHLAEDEAFVHMFLDEARIAAGIDHPNVCTVFDFGEQDGVHYLAMEFLLGEPIKRVLRAVARRKDREEIRQLPYYIARLIAEACEGLHAAHELHGPRGEPLHVVHRDVSPENIVVTYDGGVKIVDFGVAKAAERIHETKVAKIKGKFAYIAPEQLRNEGVDRRSDVWGLGVCLWEALTLRRLFRRDSDASTLSAVLFDDIPAPSAVSPWVPVELDAIVLRALTRDREGRYRTARAMGQDLRRFLTYAHDHRHGGGQRMDGAHLPARTRASTRASAGGAGRPTHPRVCGGGSRRSPELRKDAALRVGAGLAFDGSQPPRGRVPRRLRSIGRARGRCLYTGDRGAHRHGRV